MRTESVIFSNGKVVDEEAAFQINADSLSVSPTGQIFGVCRLRAGHAVLIGGSWRYVYAGRCVWCILAMAITI